ncbi:hypothetical protein QQP08_009137 [Theobroma cacao]|nr:hypothetical protein QQP08_009137 [Theobroma cacao]
MRGGGGGGDERRTERQKDKTSYGNQTANTSSARGQHMPLSLCIAASIDFLCWVRCTTLRKRSNKILRSLLQFP